MKERDNSERRQDVRINKNIPIKLFSADKYDAIAETGNISASGAYCGVNFKIPEMTKLDITLLIPRLGKISAKKIDCEGVVVRVEKNKDSVDSPYSIAIYFSNISKTDKKFISQYVKQHVSATKLS